MTETWDSVTAHPIKPPRCEVAGGTLKPVRMSSDWKLASWRYSSQSSLSYSHGASPELLTRLR